MPGRSGDAARRKCVALLMLVLAMAMLGMGNGAVFQLGRSASRAV